MLCNPTRNYFHSHLGEKNIIYRNRSFLLPRHVPVFKLHSDHELYVNNRWWSTSGNVRKRHMNISFFLTCLRQPSPREGKKRGFWAWRIIKVLIFPSDSIVGFYLQCFERPFFSSNLFLAASIWGTVVLLLHLVIFMHFFFLVAHYTLLMSHMMSPFITPTFLCDK